MGHVKEGSCGGFCRGMSTFVEVLYGSLGSTRCCTVRLASVRQSAFVKVRSVQASISYGSLGTKRRRDVRHVAFSYRWVSFGSRGGATCVQVVRGKSRFVKVRQLRQGRLVQAAQGPCPVR